MTIHWSDFNDSPSFTERWNTGDGAATIETSGLPSGATGGAALKLTQTASTRYMASWDAVGSPTGDVQLLMRWLHTGASSATGGTGRAIICGGGSAGSEDAYFGGATVSGSSATQYLAEYDNGGGTNILDSVSDTLSEDTWYWTRVEKSGTTIRAKTWEDGTSEPGTWDRSATDSTHSGGFVGPGFIANSSQTDTLWVDIISVGTGGDEAPLYQDTRDAEVSAALESLGLTRDAEVSVALQTLGLTREAWVETALVRTGIPTTIHLDKLGSVHYKARPMMSSSGAIYVLGKNVLENTMYKAIDPADVDSWTEVDAANRPSATDDPYAVMHDDEIHIVTQAINSSPLHHVFDTSTDSWTITDDEIDSGITDTETTSYAAIAVRSDGDVIVVHEGQTEDVGGTLYSRIVYSRKEGGAWTTSIALDPGGSTDYVGADIVLGADDRVHFFYLDDTNNDLYHRSLSSTNTLDSNQVLDSTVSLGFVGVLRRPIRWQDGADVRIGAAYRDSEGGFSMVQFVSEADPTPSFDLNITSPRSVDPTEGDLVYVDILDDFYFLFIEATSDDLWFVKDEGSGWGSSTELVDFITARNVAADSYIRDGRIIVAYIVDYARLTTNDYVLEYFEIDLGPVPRDAEVTIALQSVNLTRDAEVATNLVFSGSLDAMVSASLIAEVTRDADVAISLEAFDYTRDASVTVSLGSGTNRTAEVSISLQREQVSFPRTRPRYSIAIYGPLPEKDLLGIHPIPEGTELSWQTQIPGGDVGGSVGLSEEPSRRRLAYMPDPIDSVPFGHVEIRAGSNVVSEGRIVNDAMVGGSVVGIEYAGYFDALSDNYVEWTDQELTTSGRIVQRAIAAAAPLIRLGVGADFVDPGAYHSESEFDLEWPSEILENLAEEGGGDDNVPWIFTVYNRLLRFVPYAAPASPEYTIPIDETVEITRDYEPLRTHLNLQYRTDNREDRGFIELHNPKIEADLGFVRRKPITASTRTATAAQQFLQTQRTKHSEPDYGATIVRTYNRGLEMTGGGERPVWLIQSGEWVRLRGFGVLLIEQTDFDADSGELTITAGKPTRTRLAKALQRAEEAEVALHRKHDPVTKGRWNY